MSLRLHQQSWNQLYLACKFIESTRALVVSGMSLLTLLTINNALTVEILNIYRVPEN